MGTVVRFPSGRPPPDATPGPIELPAAVGARLAVSPASSPVGPTEPGPITPLVWIRSVFSAIGAAGSAAWFDSEPEPPHAEEQPGAGRVVPRRQREFAAGRQCARAALAQLGIHDFPVRSGLDRAPIWPPGVAGSITHTHLGDWLFAAAVVTRSPGTLGIGIDAEPAEALPPELLPVVLTPRELRWVKGVMKDFPDGDLLTRVLFSAKESVYKALFPVGREVLGFSDVEITLEPVGSLTQGRFHFQRGADPVAEGDAGYYCIAQGLILTAALWSNQHAPGLVTPGVC